MVASLIDQNNVQHHALTRCIDHRRATLKSKLERIRRFFAKQEIDYQEFAKTMVLQTFHCIPKMHLILDRTNWQFGKSNINYLVLAARVGKITFPLFYTLLDHSGCSDASARIELMEMFKNTFGFDKILSFTADREFIGQDWFEYLYQHKIPFFIRIKNNRLIAWKENTSQSLKVYFKNLAQEEEGVLTTHINKLNLLVVCKKIDGEDLIICSNTTNAKEVLATYKKRWDLERCFKNMKSQGFNLEGTHMTDLERLRKLMAVVSVAILYANLVGLQEQSPYKKTVRASLYSIFTRGLRLLKAKLLELDISRYILLALPILREAT